MTDKIFYKYFFLFFLLNLNNFYSLQNNFRLQKVIEKITILGEKNGYVKTITFKGRFYDKFNKSISIINNELESFNNLKKIDYYSGKLSTKGFYVSEGHIETNNFYDNLKEYKIYIEDTSSNFSIQYELLCKHLILLSNFDLLSYPNTDTAVYEIKCPNTYYLNLKQDGDTKLCKIDTLIIDNFFKKYIISFISNINPKPEFHNNDYEVKKNVFPSIRAITIPKGTVNSWIYFNNWFNNLIKGNTILKNKNFEIISSIISNKGTEDDIIRRTFDYVKSNIKYVAIENGIEAFRPRDVNDIFEKKYGDCKDMANLLCQILKYYKVEANIALISTIDYRYKTDFPSISSANHAICIVKSKTNKLYYLDATNKTGRYNIPSEFTQGQKFYLVNNEGGYSGVVPVIPANTNYSETIIKLNVRNNLLEGIMEEKKLNYSSGFIKFLHQNYSSFDFKLKINQYYNWKNQNVKCFNIETSINDSSCIVNSSYSIINAISAIEEKNFLLLNSLIFPHQYPKKISKGYRFVTYQTSNNNFIYQINFDHKINLLNKIEDLKIDNGTTAFDFKVELINNNKSILINYNFIMNKVELSDSEIIDYEKLNDEIYKKINSTIQYELIN